MKARIGYLVPEFPGQTHTWIWRDRRALEELGIEADLVSTRRPKLIVHAWAEQAQQLTHYLVPLSPRDVKDTVKALLGAGPKALARCLLVPLEIKGMSAKQRLRLAALIVIAGRFAALARERGWTQRFGLWGLDNETQTRFRRPSVDLYAGICKANGISSELVAQYAPDATARLFPG